ncbi:monovalent cation/H+ antiporter subunit E [Halorientalis salina]|uniref:monovalent cation/H+ antiporter subunit E n=1 Tax=Halorientalis salina TaxID=2932266 RepID=UPI0010AD7177|nr:monovalent cation/H+ antiporter subunit E [Halorientalis salina]
MTSGRLLVPVSESVALRNTVAYAVRHVVESKAAEGAVHFVYPYSPQMVTGMDTSGVDELLERVEVWADDDLGDDAGAVDVQTAVIGAGEYLFSPGDYADVLAEYGEREDLETVVLDPEFSPSGTTPLLPPLEAELERAGFEVLEAPVERPTRRARLVRGGNVGQFLLVAALSFGFYLLIGGSLSTFDLVTGGLSGVIVATVLWRVCFSGPVRPGRLLKRIGRMSVYTFYLVWEIVIANLQIAYVVLHPRLPIDPKMVEFDAAVWSEIPVTTLANSITLTPGTLTVDVDSQSFTVHSLTAGARDDLFSGGLERAVRFVFYGRAAARIPSPRERGEEGSDDGGAES